MAMRKASKLVVHLEDVLVGPFRGIQSVWQKLRMVQQFIVTLRAHCDCKVSLKTKFNIIEAFFHETTLELRLFGQLMDAHCVVALLCSVLQDRSPVQLSLWRAHARTSLC